MKAITLICNAVVLRRDRREYETEFAARVVESLAARGVGVGVGVALAQTMVVRKMDVPDSAHGEKVEDFLAGRVADCIERTAEPRASRVSAARTPSGGSRVKGAVLRRGSFVDPINPAAPAVRPEA